MLNEPVAGEGGGNAPVVAPGGGQGGGGVAPGGQMPEGGYIQVTPDEKQAIERVSTYQFFRGTRRSC